MSSSDMTATDSPSSTPTNPPSQSEVTTPPLRVSLPKFPKFQTPSTPASDAPAGASEPVRDPLDDAAPGTTTRSSSSSVGGTVKLDKGTVSDILRQAVLVASGFVHNVLARTEEEQQAGIWLADDKDQKQIGDPLAGIAARHGIPNDGGADVADLIVAGLGALAYVSKNAARAWSLRRGRRKLADVDPITEEQS